MKPIEFQGCNVTFAKDQPEYQPLPAFKDEKGNVTTCWEFTTEELAIIAKTGKLYISISTFNQPLQPILPYVEDDSMVIDWRLELTPEEIVEAKGFYDEMKKLLDDEGQGKLVEYTEDMVRNEGPAGAWAYFKFEHKLAPEQLNIIIKAFEYIHATKPQA